MIGVLNTVHPFEGYALSVRYIKVDGQIRITSVTHYSKDVFLALSAETLRILKLKIREL